MEGAKGCAAARNGGIGGAGVVEENRCGTGSTWLAAGEKPASRSASANCSALVVSTLVERMLKLLEASVADVACTPCGEAAMKQATQP
mmetsp:Transcript_31685/g.102336  ORF Transcript_31685/g.102336 Transcript_31685/m.102336 type:complete len:88 (-) Transcript_31685:1451-1714(-)|eukprot:scaffold4498_cov119-Isochrysis_galbana.AAC.38